MLALCSSVKKCVVIIFLLAWPVSLHAQNSGYISNHTILAQLLSRLYGIPTQVILAVATVESSGGAGPAAKVLNNHFGIVGKNNIVNQNGHKSRYKQYNNVFESYIDFCRVISRKPFYGRLKDKSDIKSWVVAISHAGYSEDPQQWEKKISG